MRSDPTLPCGLLVLAAATAACEKAPPPPEAPRPVTVFDLKTVDPVQPLQISGSVRSWNEQDVSFEVAAPVDFVVRETTNLEGRWVDEGTVVDEGDLLARLKDDEFVIARDAAAASLNVAEADLNLARTQLEKLLPARVRAAQANQARADAEYKRFVEAREKNAVAELDVIRHQADLDQRKAETDEAEAAIDSKEVEIRSLEARVDQATEALAQAQYDLDRCTLQAPFSGEVSEVFIEAGGYARVSEAVAHLVMMDPIKVDVSVSAARAAELHLNDRVTLYPLAGGEVTGFVYEKATAADPETRTFRVSVIVRNSRVLPELPADSPLRDLPRIERFDPVMRLDAADEDSPFIVEERTTLRRDEEGYYVWASDELASGGSLDAENPVLTLAKVRVVPGDQRRNFQGLYVARALSDPGQLGQGWVVAGDTPEDFAGGEVLVSLRDWQLRPGQIVPVLLGGQAPTAGHYVPMRALGSDARDGRGIVFVEDGGAARRVPVRVAEIVAEMVRVEPLDEAGAALLTDGARVILDSVHFLQDGEDVHVVRTRELTP